LPAEFIGFVHSMWPVERQMIEKSLPIGDLHVVRSIDLEYGFVGGYGGEVSN
jgi:hypothetical protein